MGALQICGKAYSNAWLFILWGKITGRELQILKVDDPIHELGVSTQIDLPGSEYFSIYKEKLYWAYPQGGSFVYEIANDKNAEIIRYIEEKLETRFKPNEASLFYKLGLKKVNMIATFGLSELLRDVDSKFKTDFYQRVLIKNEGIPTFFKSDPKVFQDLEELLFDYDIEDTDYFSEGKYRLASRQSNNFSGQQVKHNLERSDAPIKCPRFLLDVMKNSRDEVGFYEALRTQLLFNPELSPEPNWKLIKRFGLWTEWLNKKTANHLHFSNIVLNSLLNEHSQSHSEVFRRHIFWGLIQAANIELAERISVPFQCFLSEKNKPATDDFSNFYDFLNGSAAHTVKGFSDFLEVVNRQMEGEQHKIVKDFISFVQNSDYLDIESLLQSNFRRDLALTGILEDKVLKFGKEISGLDLSTVLCFLIRNKNPGLFFTSLGVGKT